MANILFFAHDPGGANAIAPLIPRLATRHAVHVYGKGPALAKLPGVEPFAEHELTRIRPDFLVTGTSSNDMTEKRLWQQAAAAGIPSLAIVDHWCNYGIRFSSLDFSRLAEFRQHCDCLPDYVLAIDDFARTEMIADGVPADRIRVLGNPHFEALVERAHQTNSVREQFAGEGERLVTYASEANEEDAGHGPERGVVADLITLLQGTGAKLVIRLHPKEDFGKYAEFSACPNVILDKHTNGIALIMASDVVVSISSMFLIEAMILGKPVISYQPSVHSPANFILTRNGVIPFINDKVRLAQELQASLQSGYIHGCHHGINLHATDGIVHFIESML